MSSMKELLLLRIDGVIEALEEAYLESLCRLFKLGLRGRMVAAGFSIIAIGFCGEVLEDAVAAGLPALK